MTLLLSLRFMSLVFEEVRNLCLGLAARGVDWKAQGSRGSLLMAGRLCVRLFANLFHRYGRCCSEDITVDLNFEVCMCDWERLFSSLCNDNANCELVLQCIMSFR